MNEKFNISTAEMLKNYISPWGGKVTHQSLQNFRNRRWDEGIEYIKYKGHIYYNSEIFKGVKK